MANYPIFRKIPPQNIKEKIVRFKSLWNKNLTDLTELAQHEYPTRIQDHRHDAIFVNAFIENLIKGSFLQETDIVRARGRVLIGLSSNEPLIMLTIPILSALASGNQVTARPSSQHQEISQFVGQLYKDSDLQKEIFKNILINDLTHEIKVSDFIMWFGSNKVCHSVGKIAADLNKPFSPESEGNDILVFLDDIDRCKIKKIVKELSLSTPRHHGKACQAIRGILAPASECNFIHRYLSTLLKQQNNSSWTIFQGARNSSFGPSIWVDEYHNIDQINTLLLKYNAGLSLSIYFNQKRSLLAKTLANNIPVSRIFFNALSDKISPTDPWGGIGESGHWGSISWPLRFTTPIQVQNSNNLL